MSATQTLRLFSAVFLGAACLMALGGCGAPDEGEAPAPDQSAYLPGDSLEPVGGNAAEDVELDLPDKVGFRDSPLRVPDAEVAPMSIDAPATGDLLIENIGAGSIQPLKAPETSIPKMAPKPMVRMSLQPEEAAMPRIAEPPPDVAAMEMMMAPAPAELSEEAPPGALAPVAEDRGDYQAVTVFYGTDRDSIAKSGLPAQPHRLWLYAAGACLLLFGLFAAVAASSSRKKLFGSLAVMSFSAAAVMAVMGGIAWLQSDGAVAGPTLEYGNDRGKFVMGTCQVSIPKNHQVAELEAPSVFKLDFVENPTKHVVLLDIEEEQPKVFFSNLQDRVNRSSRKEAFVFVHGFNVTFEDAARRTAQLAYDLKFQGAPIFYSWPSQGGLFQYAVDETNVVWTVPHLREFLKDIAGQSGAQSVHLIAHSMGNRALTSALRELSLEMRGEPPVFHEVVLTAPDIDAEIFRRDIAPAIIATARRVTLYASSNDEALVLSKQVHGYPRAGDTGDGLVVIPGIETIDVSAVDTSLLGHNYYGDNATVISDMIDLVRNSKSARERSWLEAARLDNLFYWVFRGDRRTMGTAPSESPVRY